MKLQRASRKEIKRIAIGTCILDLLMIGAFGLLALLGIMKFEPLPILLSAAIGSCLAIGSFTLLCQPCGGLLHRGYRGFDRRHTRVHRGGRRHERNAG